MENARLIDERLRRIIREVGSQTGTEIKALLIKDITGEINQLSQLAGEKRIIRLLAALKSALEEI